MCGKFLVLYSLKKLSSRDNNLFEAHLLECEQCFDDLSALDRTAGILHDYLDGPPEGLPFAPKLLKKRRYVRPLAVAASILLVAFGAWLLGGQFGASADPIEVSAHRGSAFSADLDRVSPELQAIFFTARRWVMGVRPEDGRNLLKVAEDIRGPAGNDWYEVLREWAALESFMGAPKEAERILQDALREAGKSGDVQKKQQMALAHVLLAQLKFTHQLEPQEGETALNQAKADADAAKDLETSFLILEAQSHHALLVKGNYTSAL